MFNRIESGVLVVIVLACAAAAEEPRSPVMSRKVAALETATSAAPSSAAAEVLVFERKMEAAVVRGDVAYVDSICARDLSFTHGDGWSTGHEPIGVDDRRGFLKRVENKQYLVRDLDSVKAEIHGDIAITYGRYIAENRVADPAKGAWFSVWFERVYAKRDGQWLYVSHRTVHGPTYGMTRQAVSDK